MRKGEEGPGNERGIVKGGPARCTDCWHACRHRNVLIVAGGRK